MTSSTAVDGLLAQFELTVRTEGEETRLESVANLLGADALDAQAAFTLAAAMALVDRDVEGPEDELLSRLASMLGISSAKAKQLIGGS